MVNELMGETNLRLLLPETLWLEPEHYERARANSYLLSSEDQQWQAYLTLLGKLTFADWLRERLPEHPIQDGSDQVAEISSFRVGEFKLYLVVVEHVLDEIVEIPQVAIEQPGQTAHFYVVLEVLEDQEQVVVRGFLRYDELVGCSTPVVTSQIEEVYQLPLTAFDAEINHLVFYVQQVEPSAIALPAAVAEAIEVLPPSAVGEGKTRLGQWLQGVLAEGWQTLEALVNPEVALAWSTRHTVLGAKGGKLINFGVQLGNQAVLLLITVTPASEGRIGIGAQVLPIGEEPVLPPALKLTLLSSTDKILQTVDSRDRDNYIQLKPFKGRVGTCFSIEVSLNNIPVRETFEL